MSTSEYHSSPIAVKTSDFDILGHNYTVAQVTSRCWVVTSRKTGATWQVEGYAGMLIWRAKASEWLAQQVTVRPDSHVAACDLPASGPLMFDETLEQAEQRVEKWNTVRLGSKRDTLAITARCLGDELANENETVNQKLQGAK